MEQYIQISKINDFLYSPASVYLHSIYEDFTGKIYKEKEQVEGSINHQNIDKGLYSTRGDILSGISVYSEKYGIVGKIDIYDKEKKHLIERKTKIKKIHKGYKFQLFAQYFCLQEMGYKVDKLFLHSLKDNQRYEIFPPNDLEQMAFEALIKEIKSFKAEDLLENSCDYFSTISIYSPTAW